MVAFVLELSGKAIAGCICLRSSATLEFYITAFDPKLSAFSPGNLLIEDVATWCIARGLDFDFRLTHDPYKLRWSGVFREYDVFILGVTPVGALKVAQISFREWWRRARRRVKRLARDGLPPQLLSLLKRRRRA